MQIPDALHFVPLAGMTDREVIPACPGPASFRLVRNLSKINRWTKKPWLG